MNLRKGDESDSVGPTRSRLLVFNESIAVLWNVVRKMEDLAVWAGPLLLKPGVALLILSTSARFGQLHEELHRQLPEGNDLSIKHLRRRAGLLHSALVSLYTSVGLFAFASLFGAVFGRWWRSLTFIPETMMFLGVCVVTFAAMQLIRESRLLLTVIDDKIEHKSGNQ